MTPQQAKELLPIIRAFSEGKKIECRDKYYTHCIWVNTKEPQWNELFEYRIANEKKWYRVAQVQYGTYTADEGISEHAVEQFNEFIRWLTPRIEYNCE